MVLLKQIINIYSQFLRRKKLYYFLKYYNIVITLTINKLISDLYENEESSIPFIASEDEQRNNLSISNNNKFTNSYIQLIPNLNSSIPYLFNADNNSLYSKTERIPVKNKFGQNTYKKINKNFMNNIEDNNFIDMFMKNMATVSNKNESTNKNGKRKRTMSYGNLEVKMKKDNETYKMFSNSNNNIFNNSNIINNTQSLKAIFPSYTITSPNGLLYPIIFTNNNENYINNNNLNNNILLNYQGNAPMNSNISRKMKPKPSLWYANIFSPINQISVIQDNNYAIPKYLNNSANFNSIPNVMNNYSEDYLNKQIFDFINANTKTKQNIISNISKKHNFKLNKSNGAIKINQNNKINYNTLNKNIKRKNNSYYTMNIDESSQFFSDRVNSEKSEGLEKSFEKSNKIKKNKSSMKNGRENNDINISNDKLNNKNIKINHNEMLFNSKNSKIKNINNIRSNYENINNKNNNKNIPVEYNKKLMEKQNINLNNRQKNGNNYLQQENYIYKKNNINTITNKKIKNNNYNSPTINKYINNISKKEIPIKNKTNLIKKDKINFNIQNVSKETINSKIKYVRNHNISISTFNSNENKTSLKSLNPSQYKISNAVDEQFIHNNMGEKEQEQNICDEESLTMSMQSINDSKMLELANKYVNDGKGLDKTKINDILNDKTTQKIMKKYK